MRAPALPEARRERYVLYWLAFIKTRFEAPPQRPQVVLVFTCADEAIAGELSKAGKGWSSAWANGFTASVRERFGATLDIRSEAFVLDARKASSEPMKALRACLHAMHSVSVERAPEVPKICDVMLKDLPAMKRSAGGIVPFEDIAMLPLVQRFASSYGREPADLAATALE